MREIKFRAHVKRLGWIVPVERINFDCKTVEVDLTNGNGDIAEYDFDEIDLMEYTGMPDKNGKGIYEGDIIDNSYKSPLNGEMVIQRYVIEWRDGIYKAIYIKDKPYYDRYLWMQFREVEIIGNIYEHPELLIV